MNHKAVHDAENALSAIKETAGRGNEDVLALAVQRIARNPGTAMSDLVKYRKGLVKRQDGLSGGKLRANKATVKRVDKALSHNDPAALVAAADQFIKEQAPTLKGQQERGLYAPDQTERASAIGFMRTHEGAGYGKPERLVQAAEANLKRVRAQAKGAAPKALAGARESIKVARKKINASKSGLLQANRTEATLVANLRHGSFKTPKARTRAETRVAWAHRTTEQARRRYTEAQVELDAAVKNLGNQTKDLAAKHGKAVAAAEATLKRTKAQNRPQMLSREGLPLSTPEIRQALAAGGAEPPGLISNRPGTLGRGAYYRPSTERPSGIGKRTSGKAVLEGTSDTSFDPVARQFIGGATRLQQAKNFDYVTKQGLTKPDGSYFDGTQEGLQAIENPGDFGMQLPDIHGGWTTRRAVPWPTRTSELEAQKSLARPAAAEADVPSFTNGEDFMAKTVEASQAEGPGPVVLIPRVIAERERQHFAQRLPVEKTAEAVTGLFKGAVLPTSPGWLAGNIGDIYMVRTPIARVTPRDIFAGKGIYKIAKQEMSSDDLVRAFETVTPGGIFGHVKRVQPYRAAEQFVGDSVEPLWRAASALRHAPGVEQVGNLYRAYRDAVFSLENKYIERLPQFGALAKHVRQELGMNIFRFNKAVRNGEPAVRDFVRGFRDPDRVLRAAKNIEDIYGNWGKNGPAARRFLTTWAPFWMWLRAATKFAFVTLPKDHPVLTSILAASEQMTREERQKFGLDKQQGTEPLPGFLQGGVPLPGGGVLKTSNLTTFGMFSDYPSNAASMVAPQFAQGILGAMGIDWKGDQMVDSEGRPLPEDKRALAAMLILGGAYVPFANLGKQIIDKGFKGALPTRAYDPGTTKYLRSLSESQQITVPAKGRKVGRSDEGGGVDLEKVFGGE